MGPLAGADDVGMGDGASEMSARVAAMDWSATPLGPIARWPQTLRTIVRSCLAASFPINLWCGPELVLVYNDAYRRVLGAKHPAALGQRGADVWAEIWPELAPLFESLRAGGPALHAEDAPFLMQRAGDAAGVGEEAWFTYSLSAVRDDDGEIVAFLNIATETTARVRAERAVTAALAAAERGEARLREVFEQAPTFLAILRGPEHVFELANDAYYQVVGHREIVGKSLLDALPELAGQAFKEILDGVLESGTPWVGREVPAYIARTPGAPPEQVFLDVTYLPLVAADGTRPGIIAHGSEVTAHVRARALLERAVQRTALLQDITAALARATTAAEVSEAVVTRAFHALGAVVGMITLRSADGEMLEMLGAANLPADVREAWQLYPITRTAPMAEAARTGQAIHLGTRAAMRARYPAREDIFARLGAQSLYAAPLVVHGASIGALLFMWAEERELDADEAALLNAIAEQCAQALERARLLDAQQRAAASARVQQAITAAFSAVLTREAVIGVLLDHGVPVLGAATGLAMLVSDDGSALEIAGSRGYGPAFLDVFARVPLDAPYPIAAAVRHGHAVWLEERESALRTYAGLAQVYAHGDFRATAALPLADGTGRVFGALAFNFAAPRTFDAEARALLEALARQCAQALERARLFEAERAARAEAEEARRRAEEANKAKSDFLAAMSHELRTPLNAIGGYTELMAMGVRGPVTDEQREDLARVRRSQQHLLGLINDVLNFARIEAGRVQLDCVAVGVHEMLVGVEGLVAPQAAERGHRLEMRGCDPSLALWADPERVTQILVNLLTNAVKYTEPGGRITVECGTERRAGGRAAVCIAVTDTGVGIPPDKLPSIFEPFVQVGRRLNRPTDGVGLGLAISRDLARAMGGELRVRSTPGKGSTFTLSLPAPPDDGAV